ncbi:MAG: oligosaccharide flippase family protein [Janthinobacterium lividum]
MPVIAPDPAQERTSEVAQTVKVRAISGVKALAARTAFSVLLRVISSLFLARLLFPKDYGLFGVVSSIAGLGMFLSDMGLAGALVRQDTRPSRNEAFTVFCAQQIITAMVVTAVVVTAPLLIPLYALPPSAATLLYAMAFGLFFSSLRIVPMMALERDLKFTIIARCELLENLVQTGSTIALAYLGWGAWALAGGGLLRGIAGLALVWTASPWRPVGNFEIAIVRRLAKFGIAYQINALIPTLLGGWMPLVVGRILGVAAVGLVGWAANLASVPLMLSAVLNRVAFPAYSRLQSDPEALGRYLTASIRRTGAVLSLAVPLIVFTCPVAIAALFHARWAPAIPLVQWLSLECSVLTLTGLLASAQNAMGHSGERLGVTIGIGGLRWGLGFLAVRHFGLLGIGPAVFSISLFETWVSAHLVMRHAPGCRRLRREIFQPILTVGAFLTAALGTGSALASHSILQRAITELFVFLGLVALREKATGGRILGTELCAIYAMLQPQRREQNAC